MRGVNQGYGRALDWSLQHGKPVLGFLVVTALLAGGLFSVIPSTLVPTEDRGSFLTVVRAPDGSTLAYTDQSLTQVEQQLNDVPEIEAFFAAIGLSFGGPRNTTGGFVYARLLPWDQRDVTQQAIVAGLFPGFMQIPGALVFPINLPSLGQNTLSDVEFVIKNSSATLDEFAGVTDTMLAQVTTGSRAGQC